MYSLKTQPLTWSTAEAGAGLWWCHPSSSLVYSLRESLRLVLAILMIFCPIKHCWSNLSYFLKQRRLVTGSPYLISVLVRSISRLSASFMQRQWNVFFIANAIVVLLFDVSFLPSKAVYITTQLRMRCAASECQKSFISVITSHSRSFFLPNAIHHPFHSCDNLVYCPRTLYTVRKFWNSKSPVTWFFMLNRTRNSASFQDRGNGIPGKDFILLDFLWDTFRNISRDRRPFGFFSCHTWQFNSNEALRVWKGFRNFTLTMK